MDLILKLISAIINMRNLMLFQIRNKSLLFLLLSAIFVCRVAYPFTSSTNDTKKEAEKLSDDYNIEESKSFKEYEKSEQEIGEQPSSSFSSKSSVELSGEEDLLRLRNAPSGSYPHLSCIVIIQTLIGVQQHAYNLSRLAHQATMEFFDSLVKDYNMLSKISDSSPQKIDKSLLTRNFEKVRIGDFLFVAKKIKQHTADYVRSAEAAHKTYDVSHNDDETWKSIQSYIGDCIDAIAVSMLRAKEAYEFCANPCNDQKLIQKSVKKLITDYIREHGKDDKLKRFVFSHLKKDKNYQYAINQMEGGDPMIVQSTPSDTPTPPPSKKQGGFSLAKTLLPALGAVFGVPPAATALGSGSGENSFSSISGLFSKNKTGNSK